MEKHDDTLDHIRAYLKGRLSPAEKAAFEAKMKADPSLEDKVAFASLLMAGLSEMSTKRKKNYHQRIKIAAVLLLLLLILACFYFFQNNQIDKSGQKPAIHRVSETMNHPPGVMAEQGGGHSDAVSDRANTVAWTTSGEAILSGQYAGPALFGQIELPAFGEEDGFIAAFSPDHGYTWAKSFGSRTGTVSCNDLAIDHNNNIYVTGRLFDQTVFDGRLFSAIGISNVGPSDFYIAKCSPKGDLIWLDHAGGMVVPDLQTGDNLGRSVDVDNEGNIVAAGDYIGTPTMGDFRLPAGGPNEDTYLAKYTADGKVLWAKAITGQYMVSVFDVATDNFNNIFVIGYFGHHNLGGQIYLDHLTLNTFGGRDIFLAKYSSAGDLLWARQAGSNSTGREGYDYGKDIATDLKGGCLITGWFQGEARFEDTILHTAGDRDMFLASYGPNGDLRWVRSAGGSLQDQGATVIIDEEGNGYCAGYFQGNATFANQQLSSLGESDIFIGKYDRQGKLRWLRQMGGNSTQWNSDSATEMSINNLGQIVLTGYFSGKMNIGDKTLDSQGREDVFLVFFDKKGNLLESKQLSL